MQKLRDYSEITLARFRLQLESDLFFSQLEHKLTKCMLHWGLSFEIKAIEYEYLSQPNKTCYELFAFNVKFANKKAIEFIIQRDGLYVSIRNQFIEASSERGIILRSCLFKEIQTTYYKELYQYVPARWTHQDIMFFVEDLIKNAMTHQIIVI
jgi:hypothetical protein